MLGSFVFEYSSTSKSGSFSVKFAYLIENELRFQEYTSVGCIWWKKLWNSQLHNRHKQFLWKILSCSMSTKARLAKFLPLDDDFCFICREEQETLEHLFLRCPLIKCLWFTSTWKLRMEPFLDWSIIRWITELLNPSNSFPLTIKENSKLLNHAVIIMEQVWLFRNKVRLNEKNPTWEELAVKTHNMAQQYWEASLSRKLKTSTQAVENQWKPPPANWIKIDFDAALDDEGNTISAAIIRNEKAEILGALIERDLAGDSYVVEAAAALLALKIGDDRKYGKAIFEGDSLNIIKALNGFGPAEEWCGLSLVEPGRRLLAKWPHWKVHFINRNANTYAHNFAQWAKCNHVKGYIPPSLLPPAAIFDKGGTDLVIPDPLMEYDG